VRVVDGTDPGAVRCQLWAAIGPNDPAAAVVQVLPFVVRDVRPDGLRRIESKPAGQPVTLFQFPLPAGTGQDQMVWVCDFVAVNPPPDWLTPGPPPAQAVRSFWLVAGAVAFQFVIPALLIGIGTLVLGWNDGGGGWAAGTGSLISGLATLWVVAGCRFWGWRTDLGADLADGLIASGLLLAVGVDVLQFGLVRAARVILGIAPPPLTPPERTFLMEYLRLADPGSSAFREAALDFNGLGLIRQQVHLDATSYDFTTQVLNTAVQTRSVDDKGRPLIVTLVDWLEKHPKLQSAQVKANLDQIRKKYARQP
jgi:hypothetical protein